MSRSLRVMTIDDVNTDEDLKRFFKTTRSIVNALSMMLALAAATLKAMLKDYDKKAGKRRRGKVARPLALAAGTLILVSKFLTLAARRFDQEYNEEIAASGRRRQQSRRIRFGG